MVDRKKAPPRVGISAEGRSKTYKSRGLWAIKKKHGGKFPSHPKQEKAPVAAAKAPKYYPADDVKQPRKRHSTRQSTKLRHSITPGTVLILLAGRFKGRRVVFLKQLESGLLLVTGPFTVNGVPLRRVNQAYTIATSTKVDVSSADLSSLTDAQFVPKKAAKKKGGDKFFEQPEGKKELDPEFLSAQKAVDGAIAGSLEGELKGYLASHFSLRSGDRPHLMKF
ncbi:hypothetical protein WJX73_002844 [Symbiochloris irregularis]|uniref:60S ribosomal protein L6 n=1 Tax=Symbiochloris irregularis TaxID=706552 RepID=A0AAW1NRC8_9CHLO